MATADVSATLILNIIKRNNHLFSFQVRRNQRQDALYKVSLSMSSCGGAEDSFLDVHPKWYSYCVWTGEQTPPDKERRPKGKDILSPQIHD